MAAQNMKISACKNKRMNPGRTHRRPVPAGRSPGAAHPNRAPHGSTGRPRARFIPLSVYLRGASRCAGGQRHDTHLCPPCKDLAGGAGPVASAPAAATARQGHRLARPCPRDKPPRWGGRPSPRWAAIRAGPPHGGAFEQLLRLAVLTFAKSTASRLALRWIWTCETYPTVH